MPATEGERIKEAMRESARYAREGREKDAEKQVREACMVLGINRVRQYLEELQQLAED